MTQQDSPNLPQYLANALQAIVPEAKILRYLLSLDHPKGKSKAKFFLSFGFTTAQWDVFADALRDHAIDNPLVEINREAEFGVRYVVEGTLITPDRRNPKVCVVWYKEKDDTTELPRLVTAYPADKS
jgi:hypothetical protein